MTNRRPRSVLAIALAMLAAILGLFTIALLDTRADKRESADTRFQDRAKVAASLIDSLLSSSAPQSAERYARAVGGERVTTRALDRLAQRGRSTYAVVLDERGVPLAASSRTTPKQLQAIARTPGHVRRVLDGETFRISGLTPGTGNVEFASGFESHAGDRRVMVSATPAAFLATFLRGYLNGIPGAEASKSYVLDGAGRVLGTAEDDQPVGEPAAEGNLLAALNGSRRFGEFDADGGHRFAAEPVKFTSWRVVLTEGEDTLYSEAGGMLEWLILFALALAGLFTVMLLHRDARSAERLRDAFARLSDVNAELAHSNVELKRSNAELEQFASVASHDLQEPLRKVQTFGDQLERRFGDEIPDEAKDYLRRMRRAANRMSTLIEDLLRFSRVTTHAKPPRSVDLSRVAREVTADLEALVAETHGRVEIGALPRLEADPLQMRQLLQNLIGNALKFHRPGEPPVVEVRPSDAPAGMVSFSVADNGIGFEPVYAERIFRVFERLHPRDVYDGTGIGLALCRKIVERHGGTIQAEGRPDAGARFVVTMPVTQPVHHVPSEAAGEPAPAAPEVEPAHV